MNAPRSPRPTLLICAGHDPSAGAGSLADLRAATTLGLLPFLALTGVTAQDHDRITGVFPLPAPQLQEQLQLGFAQKPRAAKVGMVGTRENAQILAKELEMRTLPLVFDPVARSTTGGDLMLPLLPESFAPLLPYTTLLTPNSVETHFFTGLTPTDPESAVRAGEKLCALGPKAVLMKGGHLQGNPVDYLYWEGNLTLFQGVRVEGPNVRGTGCWLSTLIAGRLALGMALESAVEASIRDLRNRLPGAHALSSKTAILLS